MFHLMGSVPHFGVVRTTIKKVLTDTPTGESLSLAARCGLAGSFGLNPVSRGATMQIINISR